MSEQSKQYTDQELTAFAIGELDATRAAEIEQMLMCDAEGRQAVDELSGVAGLLSRQLACEPTPELTAQQRRVIESGPQTSPLRFSWRVPLSLAASILVLLGVGYMMTRDRPVPPRPIAGDTVKPVPLVDEKVQLDIEYPGAYPIGTPGVVSDPHVAVPSLEPPAPIYVPVGTINLSQGRPVTSNAEISADKLKIITDGDKTGSTGLNIGSGLQWVQVDLGGQADVYAVAVWHYHDDGEARAYRDVIVQVSDDPNFAKYTTVFSTDHDKSAGMELGSDMGYVESVIGKVIECNAAGRYVRLYSKGNTSDDLNHYAEVEVHGIKRSTPKPSTTPTPEPTSTATRKRRVRAETVPLKIKYPKALFIGTPIPVNEPNIQKPTGKAPITARVPKGTVNLALGKSVTSNEVLPTGGELEMVTDGEKSGEDGTIVGISIGHKWVQIDLEASCSITAIAVWHYHAEARAYRDVVVRVSDDPDFIESTTVFNSDHDNSSGMGVGVHMGYVETQHGKLIWCGKATRGRYVRLYSKGNTSNDQNHYVEVEVYGRAPKGKAPAVKPATKKTPTTQPAAKSKEKKVVLNIKFPKMGSSPYFAGINEPNVERPLWKRPGPILVPEGTVNLALGKSVTSNETLPVVGALEMVTDGSNSGEDGHIVDIGFGLKWVQIDLQAASDITVIGMWHYPAHLRVYRDVVVRVSDDPEFRKYTTVFNNDHDNSSKLGVGKDKGYLETVYGKLIVCKDIRGRYVRLYSKGNTSNDQNHYVEVGVYGVKSNTKTSSVSNSAPTLTSLRL